MNKPYLLTYKTWGGTSFLWFDTQDEMDEFVEGNNAIQIIEAFHIIDAESITY